MRYQVLATDYDGTLAHHGKVDDATVDALKRMLATGRRLVLVTGRELPDLFKVFPQMDLCEWVVAENGGLLYRPATKEERPLAPPPPESFVNVLKAKAAGPLSIGKVIVATWEPDEKIVLDTIRQLGVEMQVIFNKGAVMVLPAGVNKASGLVAALKEMGLSPHNVLGVGDAENDHAFLRLCEFSAAVANALPALKETADFVTQGDHGIGVTELINDLVETDLYQHNEQLTRHHLGLGTSDGEEVRLSPYGPSILIAGPSASGKSTVATRIIETLVEQKYQFCLIDPEGDYETFEGGFVFGGPTVAPVEDEVMRLLEKPRSSATVCLTGVPIAERPPLFLKLLSHLLQMRARTGRPHWIVLDEAHHLMPAEWQLPEGMLPEHLVNFLLITVHPDLLSPMLLSRLDTIMGVGPDALPTLESFAKAAKLKLPRFTAPEVEPGELLLWLRDSGEPPKKVKAYPCQSERRRHRRKYAEGQLPPDRSFYFEGPHGKLHLRAQNLMLFLQLAEGIDDETWEHHLYNGDYSRWFRQAIKDDELATATERIEREQGLSAADSRKKVREAIEHDYTLPASPLPVAGAS